VCDHSGNLMWYSGPHIGVTHNVRLFHENTPGPRLDRGEQLLGDKAYVGNPLLIAPHKMVWGALSQRCVCVVHRELGANENTLSLFGCLRTVANRQSNNWAVCSSPSTPQKISKRGLIFDRLYMRLTYPLLVPQQRC